MVSVIIMEIGFWLYVLIRNPLHNVMIYNVKYILLLMVTIITNC